MPSQAKLDKLYMDIARRVSEMSHAHRKKVGAVLVKDNNIISYGWNGTPSGDDNACEVELPGGELQTKPEVLHAELNLFSKLTANGGVGAQGATLYLTLSPCRECAKLIKQAKLARVVFDEFYRERDGVDFLVSRGVEVNQFSSEGEQ